MSCDELAQRYDEERLLAQDDIAPESLSGLHSCAARVPGSTRIWGVIASVSSVALAATVYSKASAGARPAKTADGGFQSLASARLRSLQVDSLSSGAHPDDVTPVLLGENCCRPYDLLIEETDKGKNYTRALCEAHCKSNKDCDAFAISGCFDGATGSCSGMCHTYHLQDNATWVTDSCIDPALDGNTYCYYMQGPSTSDDGSEDEGGEEKDKCLPDIWWIRDFTGQAVLFPYWANESAMPQNLEEECPFFKSSTLTLKHELVSELYPGNSFTEVRVATHSVQPSGNVLTGNPPVPTDASMACATSWVYSDFNALKGEYFCDNDYMELFTNCKKTCDPA